MRIPQYIQNNEIIGNCSKKRLPYVLSKEQLLQILSNLDCIHLGIIIYIGSFQGLRIGEIIRLKWSDVDLKYGEMRILDAKNTKRYKSGYGKDRVVPINEMFIPLLKKWRMINEQEEYVIPGNSRRDEGYVQSMVRDYQKKFHRILEKVGLDEVSHYQEDGKPRYKYHLHTLRHVCGTNLYRAGMDLYQIKEFLGHEKIETTQIYCELAKDDLRLASHKAYAYPKSQIPLPENDFVQIEPSTGTLQLQKEIVEKQLELARMRMLYAPQQTI